jgi:hypothetical protein
VTLAGLSGPDMYQALTKLAGADKSRALINSVLAFIYRTYVVIEMARWRNGARLGVLVLVWGVRRRVQRRGFDRRQNPSPGHNVSAILPQLAQKAPGLDNAGVAR